MITNTNIRERNSEDSGKCFAISCTAIILVALMIIIMAITGEFNKKN